LVLEGTPDEIGRVLEQIDMKGVSWASARIETDASPEEVGHPVFPLGRVNPKRPAPSQFVTIDFARSVMTRIPMSNPLREVLRALYRAHPKWLLADELYSASGYDPQPFAGLMGAFGRRLRNTPGYNVNDDFFDYEWDEEAKSWRYRLPNSVCEAMRIEQMD